MILVTHGVIGAALGRLFPRYPFLAFLAGFVSHFLADAIPHWHYKLFSHTRHPDDPIQNDMVIGKKFLIDLMDIGLDGTAGLALPILLFQGWAGFSHPDWSVLAGAFGGLLPDFFHFVYMKIRREPFYSFQRFHVWMHSKTDIDKKPLIGIGSQLLIIVAAALLSRVLL